MNVNKEFFSETEMSLGAVVEDPDIKKIIYRRKTKRSHRVIDSSKTFFSVMFSGRASGDLLPPLMDGCTEGIKERAIN